MRSLCLLIGLIIIFSCTNPTSTDNDQMEGDQIYASHRRDIIWDYARSLQSDVGLYWVYCNDVEPTGASECWSYRFYSHSVDSAYIIHNTQDSLTLERLPDGAIIGPGYITSPWCDSNIAFRIAEKNGGKDFRESYPDCDITAYLSQGIWFEESQWGIRYTAADSCVRIVINATTQEFSGISDWTPRR